MCKRFFSVLASIIIMMSGTLVSSAESNNIDISAESAVLIVAQTGEIVYSRNCDKQMSMASTTKIMTSIIALESGRLDEEIIITDEMVRVEGTSMGLLAGDSISLRELVYGMLLESGNDAANVTAYVMAGSLAEFAVMMNNKAKEIGMNNTNFVTPSGLDDELHYSTAYDMALLGAYAIKNSDFRSICSTYTAYVDYGNPPYRRCLTNHNKLLRTYDGVFGIKTGFTKKSGRCLVTAAEKDGVELVCVTLNAPNDWRDHERLLDFGFQKVKPFEMGGYADMSIPIISSETKKIKTKLAFKPLIYGVKDNVSYMCSITVEPFLYAPVKEGDIVGNAQFFDSSGNLLSEIPVVSAENAECDTVENSVNIKQSFFERIINYLAGERND